MPNYKFEVRLENVDLTKKQVKEIDAAINSVIGKAIISSGLNKEILGSKLRINPEWLGIWIKKFNSPELLDKTELFKQIRFQ